MIDPNNKTEAGNNRNSVASVQIPSSASSSSLTSLSSKRKYRIFKPFIDDICFVFVFVFFYILNHDETNDYF
jgi:hypothetical protein